MAEYLGIDIGGTGIKAALVDTAEGRLVTERLRVDTPSPSTPKKVAKAIAQLVADKGYSGPVGCCFPAVVVNGQAKTASNIDDAWLDTNIEQTFHDATGLPFTVLNDADAAGVAEMRFGAGRGLQGTVIMITIGTGIGSGLFRDGQLLPNTELGRMMGPNDEFIERHASNKTRKDHELSWDDWGERFNYLLEQASTVYAPDHIILGGGVSKKFAKFAESITVAPKIHIAEFLNNAGIVGAAVAAAEANARKT